MLISVEKDEERVSVYYSKAFLIMHNKILHFSVYDLIYTLFGNNNLAWKLQFRYAGLLAEVSVPSIIVCYYCFYYLNSFYEYL